MKSFPMRQVMKILLLSPKIDAQHKIARELKQEGIIFLFPDDVREAWNMLELHQSSIDLAILNLEDSFGKQEGTLDLLKKIKTDSFHKDLPYILITERWNDAQCALHQEGPEAAHAYLRWPFSVKVLLETLKQIFVEDFQSLLGMSSSAFSASASTLSSHSEISITLGEAKQIPDAPEIALSSPLTSSVNSEISITLGKTQQIPDAPEIGLSSPLTSSVNSEISITLGKTQQIPDAPEIDLSIPLPPSGSSDILITLGEAQQIPDAPALELPQVLEMPSTSDETQNLKIIKPLDFSISSSDLEISHSENDSFELSNSPVTPTTLPPPYQAIGNAVVPGGMSSDPDLETFKKYLLLREQDVSILSHQLKGAREQLAHMDQLCKAEQQKSEAFSLQLAQSQAQLNALHETMSLSHASFEEQVKASHQQLRLKMDQEKRLQKQLAESEASMEALKERIRLDIRKIRVHEKELENRLEIMKTDSEALLKARENKVVELKRKVETLEFNMELLKTKCDEEKQKNLILKERLSQVAQAFRLAGGLLDTPHEASEKIMTALSEQDASENLKNENKSF